MESKSAHSNDYDDFEEFNNAYIKNIQDISKITMIKLDWIDTDLINANICWLSSDNMMEILVKDNDPDNVDYFNFDTNDKIKIYDTRRCDKKYRNENDMANFLGRNLYANKFIIISMTGCDSDEKTLSEDHWFCVFSSTSNDGIVTVYLIEYGGPDKCHVYETYNLPDFVTWLTDVMVGKIPDRFYGHTSTHTIQMKAYDRYPINANTILLYLINNEEILKTWPMLIGDQPISNIYAKEIPKITITSYM